jgi:predicted nucleic acid-binding protein
VIYLDTSVAVAALFSESLRPADDFWETEMVSSRLLTYELWTRVHARGLSKRLAEPVRALTDRILLVELSDEVLARMLEPFPVAVRTLDAMHLSSMDYLRGLGMQVELASFDKRLQSAARAMGFAVVAV